MKTTGRHQLRHRLPRGYFADAPLSHFEAADSATSAGQKGTTPTARADTHAAASTIAPPSGDDRSADLVSRRDGGPSLPKLGSFGVCSTEGFAAGGGERSHAAGLACPLPHLSGPASIKF